MIRITGLEWKRFYSDATVWDGEIWHEDEELTINGVTTNTTTTDLEKVEDADLLTITGGYIDSSNHKDPRYGKTLESLIKSWRKKQSTITLVIEFPKEKEKILRGVLKDYSVRVLG